MRLRRCALLTVSALALPLAAAPGQAPVGVRDLQVVTRIGLQAGPAYELQMPRFGVTATLGGGVLVPQPDLHEIREFDSRGLHVRTLGRRGRGPGEFEGIRAVRQFADTV